MQPAPSPILIVVRVERGCEGGKRAFEKLKNRIIGGDGFVFSILERLI